VVSEKIGVIGENIQLRRISVLDQPAGTRLFSYVHMGGKIGVLLRLKGEDGALNGDKGAELGKDLAMQVAAANPLTMRREEIPKEKIESESAIFRELALKEGKPEKILDRIVQGRLNKFYQENCLLEQPFIKETEKSVSKHIDETSKGAGAGLSVDAFVRFQLGAE
jgi:elongation factor Ts